MFWLKISLTLTFLQCMKEREICVRRGGGSTPKFSSPAAGTGSFSDIGFNCTTYLEHHSMVRRRVRALERLRLDSIITMLGIGHGMRKTGHILVGEVQ